MMKAWLSFFACTAIGLGAIVVGFNHDMPAVGLAGIIWGLPAGLALTIALEGQPMTDKRIADLEAENRQLRDLLTECASDLKAELDARYDGTLHYPDMRRRYERDMDIVRRARKAAGLEVSDG